MIAILQRAFAPRPVMSTRRLVGLATLARLEQLPTEPIPVVAVPEPRRPGGRHRRTPGTRPLAIGERW